jgi:hypothetical protein
MNIAKNISTRIVSLFIKRADKEAVSAKMLQHSDKETITRIATSAIEQSDKDSITDMVIKDASNAKVFNEYYNRTSGRIDYKRQAVILRKKTIEDWIRAMMSATDPENPRRGDLMRLYYNFKTDLHLMSCIDNRVLPVKCAKFKLVDASGNEDTEAHKLLERPWFITLVEIVCNATFEGTQLVEMFDTYQSGELKGELMSVRAIDQSNFIPKQGIIINEEYDQKGTDYRSGAYSNYYVQVGGDWDLGMFSQIALIIIAKKLSLGSWLNYLDKFGVPPVFIITERMDTTRRDELHDMMVNFRQNNFTILQGNERFEVPNLNNADAYQVFLSLISDVANKEMSKRILGGVGVSDEKSFVGAAEVQERLLKLRNAVDKLMFKFYFNTEFRPRLVKLSSAYAPLAKLSLEFDDSEQLSLKDIIASIKDLSPYYTFDVEELAKITGLPITDIKSAVSSPPTEPPVNDKNGKKPAAAVNRTGITAATTLDAATTRIINDVFDDKIQPQDLDQEYVNAAYSNLSSTSQSAWGTGYATNPTAARLRHNMMRFSGAKTYDLISKLAEVKTGAKTKDEYMKAAKSIAATHNGAWMDVERRFAGASSASARDFLQFQADIDKYPNLKLRTMADDDVRDTHAVMEGMVKPVNEWKVTPPFDPNCRCILEQTTDEPLDKPMKINAQYANNPAISGQVFTEKHPYNQRIDVKLQKTVRDNTEQIKKGSEYRLSVEQENGKKIFLSDFADPEDIEDNVSAARKIGGLTNKDIYIRHHLYVDDEKNPELGIGSSDDICDLKTLTGNSIKNFINNRAKDASSQGCSSVVFDISKEKQEVYVVLSAVLRGTFADMSRNKNIKHIYIIKGDKAYMITRRQIIDNDFKSIQGI